MTPLVSVIIPTWNRADLALECLDSLSRQTYPSLEVIVVDDASSDSTAARVRAAHPSVTVLALEKNGGFARAANAGIRASKGAWVLLLNNDVTLDAALLERMLARANETGATMVAPLLLWRDEPERIYSAGDRLRVDGRPEAVGFRQARGEFRFDESPFGVSAACGLYHRSLFEDVGLLEERFVAYFEDADLCFRARLAGHRAALACDAVAWHIGSASIEGNTWWRSAQCYRNHALLVLRNFPAPLLWRHVAVLLRERRHQRGMMFRAARVQFGAARAALISLRYAAWLAVSLPGALRARALIQARKILADDVLQVLLTSSPK